jgi:RNA polymerase sigma factor (sigma-70 family)
MSALLQAPETDGENDGSAIDRRLVAAVRRGDDRAFEALYERYHRRIHAYVVGMVKDHQRAEDVTQDVFMSAVRRMRATERPIAFKPWIYEIAKNACIDQFRRSRRAEEVSFDAEDGLAPADYGRLVSPEPVPDAALLTKQRLDDLCGAFGGLSDAHHEILVLRELEGLSYREIGERMGLTRPAVESTLFRARRRLTEEYDELASGQRCLRIHSIIESAGANGRLGARDTRRLARHVAHCQPCRREALAAGVDSALLTRRPVRERVAAKIAALFPFPFLRRAGGGDGGSGWLHQLPLAGDQAAPAAKLAAAAVLVIAGLGVGSQVAPSHHGPSAGGPASLGTAERTAAPSGAGTPATGARPATQVSHVVGARRGAASKPKAKARTRSGRHTGAARSLPRRTTSRTAPASGGGSAPAASGGGSNPKPSSGSGSGSGTHSGSGSGGGLPAVTKPVQQTTQTVDQTVDQVTDTIDDATSGAAAPVTGVVDDTVHGVTGTVGGAVQDPVGTVGGAVQDPVGTVGGAVQDPVGAVGGAVQDPVGTVGGAAGGVLP